MMCRQYVTSSASTRRNDGCTLFSARWKRRERHLAELVGELVLEPRIEETPRRDAAADEVLPHAALRLVERGRHALCERRARVRRIDLPLVDAVAELVQAREDPVQRVLVEVRRETDVGRRERRRERMHRLVEPPGRAVHPPPLEHGEREPPLRLAREAAREARVVDRVGVGDRPDHRQERCLEPVEDHLDLDRLHAGLVVVEDDVVRVAVVVEAGDVLAAQLEVPLEVREHEREVLLLARAQPALVAVRAGARQLGAQLGRDADGLLVVAPADPDEGGLERLLVVRLLERPQLLEERAEVGSRPGARARSGSGVARCSARASAPADGIFVSSSQREDARRFFDVMDLAQAAPELLEAFVHPGQGTASIRRDG